MKNKTDIVLVVDNSGSMATIAKDMEGGFETFLKEQKKVEGDATISLYSFANSVKEEYVQKDLKDVKGLKIKPMGSTALFDAIKYAVDQTGQRLASLCECDRPSKVLICVVTDGQENASHRATLSEIKEMINHQKCKYNWSFAFLGANIDSFAAGGSMGIARGATMNYVADSAGVDNMWMNMERSVASYRCADKGVQFAFAPEKKEDKVK